MEIFTVDAFTKKPFAGNPAAVCVISEASSVLEPDVMQKIAAEMNLSETAFVHPLDFSEDVKNASSFSLKWFTPICEVSLCGHATLATAAVIFNSFKNPNQELTFSTLSGELKAVRGPEGEGICLDLPLADTEPEDPKEIKELLKTVVGELPIADCKYSPRTRKLLVRLDDRVTRNQLEALCPNTDGMVAAHSGKIRGVIITVKSTDDVKYDFLSRYFAPWVGIPEDPVTGSAHTVLGPFWSRELSKTTLRARQCSPRGGELLVTVKEDTVVLLGAACIIMQGKVNLNS